MQKTAQEKMIVGQKYWKRMVRQSVVGLELVLPVVVGDADPVDVLLAADLLFLLLLLVGLDVADVFDVGEAEHDHDVVDELDFDAVVEEDGGLLEVLVQAVAVGVDDGAGEGEEEVEEAVVEGEDEVGRFGGDVLEVGVAARPQSAEALLALEGVEGLLGGEPLALELLVEFADLLAEALVVDGVALDQLGELLLRDDDAALRVGPEQQDLVQVLRDDVALLDDQELGLPEELLVDELLLAVVAAQAVEEVAQEDNLLLVVDELAVGLARGVDVGATVPPHLRHLARPPLQVLGRNLLHGQAVQHELRLADLLRLHRPLPALDLLAELLDFAPQVGVRLELLHGDPLLLLVLEHLLQHVQQQRVQSWRLGHLDAVLALDLGEDAEHLEGLPGQVLEEHEVEGDPQRPDVGLVGVLVLPEDLRRHELHGAREGGRLLVAVVAADDLRHPEVRDLHVAAVDQDVLRLYVAVDDAVALQELQRDHHLRHEPPHDPLLHLALLLQDEVLQSALVAVLQDQVERRGALLGVHVLQDVGVRHLPQQVDLLQDRVRRHERGVDRDLLDGELGVLVGLLELGPVVPQVHLGHRPLPQQLRVVHLVLVDQQVLLLAHDGPPAAVQSQYIQCRKETNMLVKPLEINQQPHSSNRQLPAVSSAIHLPNININIQSKLTIAMIKEQCPDKQLVHSKPSRKTFTFNRKELLWNQKENSLYAQFLVNHSTDFQCENSRRSKKIFLLLSKSIGTRTADQCRSHHQKMVKTHRSIKSIVEYIEQKYSASIQQSQINKQNSGRPQVKVQESREKVERLAVKEEPVKVESPKVQHPMFYYPSAFSMFQPVASSGMEQFFKNPGYAYQWIQKYPY